MLTNHEFYLYCSPFLRPVGEWFLKINSSSVNETMKHQTYFYSSPCHCLKIRLVSTKHISLCTKPYMAA